MLRTLRLLSIVVWVGGILFFAFVVAPVSFSLLPSQHLAGIVVGGTLRVLDLMGLASGAIFCIATGILFRSSQPKAKRRHEIEFVLAASMLLATGYLHAGILPAMERDRADAGGNIETAPPIDPAKIHFERLHKRSEQLEGVVLFLGLGIVILIGREPASEF